MAKSLRSIVPRKVKTDVPLIPQRPSQEAKEKAFVDQHDLTVVPDANGNDDDVFKGSKQNKKELGPNVGAKDEPAKIKEDVEQIDELRKMTIQRYLRKANSSEKKDTPQRQKAMTLAKDKLKEDVEQIDELSKKTLTSYSKKSKTSEDRNDRKGDQEEDRAMSTDGEKNPAKQDRHVKAASAFQRVAARRRDGQALASKKLKED
jgi:hypothetical protein